MVQSYTYKLVLQQNRNLWLEAYSEPCQTSKMERLAKIVNGCRLSFFTSNAFFQLRISAALLFSELSVKCFLTVACYLLHIAMILPRHVIFCIFASRLSLGLLIIWSIFHIILIFIATNHLISLKQTHSFFGKYLLKDQS